MTTKISDNNEGDGAALTNHMSAPSLWKISPAIRLRSNERSRLWKRLWRNARIQVLPDFGKLASQTMSPMEVRPQ